MRAESDPLQVAAISSAKASKALLLSVAQAGSRLIAVGEHGIIIYSDNQGKSWTQARVPVSVTLTAVYFPDMRTGWAVGHDGIVLRSQDGGQTWEKRFDGNQANALMQAEAQQRLSALQNATGTDPAELQEAQNALADVLAGAKFGPARPLLGVWFASSTEGFIVGAFGQLFHTVDAGMHWESIASRVNNPEGLHFNAISQVPHGALLISGEGGKIYRSENNGASWKTLDTGYQGQLYGVLAVAAPGNHERLLAYGFGGHAWLEDDRSAWQPLDIPTKKNLIGAVQTPDGGIVLVAQDRTVLGSDATAHAFQIVLAGLAAPIAGMTLVKSDTGNWSIVTAGSDGMHVNSLKIEKK